MTDIGAWSQFLTAHGPWPAFCAVSLIANGYLIKRLGAVQDKSANIAEKSAAALAEFSTLLRERLPR